MNSFSIRKAKSKDIARIGQVLADTWKGSYADYFSASFLEHLTGERWYSFLEQGFAEGKIMAHVAEQDAQMVGVAVYRASEMEVYPGDLELMSLYVLPAFQGKGIGQALFERVYDIAKKDFKSRCVLDVIDKNKQAIGFYQKNNFSIVSGPFELELHQSKVMCYVMRKTN